MALAITTAVVIGVALVAGLSFVLFSRQFARERDSTLQREAQAFAALITTSVSEETEDVAFEAARYLSAREPGVGPVLVVRQAGKPPLAAPSSTPVSGRAVAVVEAALPSATLQHTAAGLLRALVIARRLVELHRGSTRCSERASGRGGVRADLPLAQGP